MYFWPLTTKRTVFESHEFKTRGEVMYIYDLYTNVYPFLKMSLLIDHIFDDFWRHLTHPDYKVGCFLFLTFLL